MKRCDSIFSLSIFKKEWVIWENFHMFEYILIDTTDSLNKGDMYLSNMLECFGQFLECFGNQGRESQAPDLQES